MKHISVIIFCAVFILFTNQYLSAQSNIDNVLREIASNSKEIKASSDLVNARKMEFNTGLAPYNPEVSYDYLFGSPKGIGNQTEFTLNFSFDFPTIYGKRSTLADIRTAQVNYDLQSVKQDVLLEAKLTCIELVYLNRRNIELQRRLNDAQKLYDYFQTRLQTGEGNVIDANKAKLQVINYQSDYQLNQIEINKANNKLTELNGGKPITFTDTQYPPVEEIPEFVELEAEIEANDPTLKRLNLQYEISKQEISINKDLNLPKIELGYRYQGLLNQNFNGVHAGISIPLWEGNNRVKAKELQSIYSLALIEEHKNEHYFETKRMYDEFISLRNTLSESIGALSTINNAELLQKSFSLGEISSIDYLMELTYYYSIKDKLDLIEKEYYITLSKLLKYNL
ncbi:MAG TPA: TolC family protein [Ignavibacteria bacterium]|nr:TolC family protein [Ignavibacteria bacterium]